ncbi:unnamed protein product [marine sediment metagenome]|uniref:Uncharacterized protein n=1 Tax=marine sediment metagenome TaxID=412755 RepID=X1DL12_9ZZZZ
MVEFAAPDDFERQDESVHALLRKVFGTFEHYHPGRVSRPPKVQVSNIEGDTRILLDFGVEYTDADDMMAMNTTLNAIIQKLGLDH